MTKKLDILHFRDWLGLEGPLLIAGPCGAESREQVLQTAEGIAALKNVKIFRAGIWKPRTRPNSFEGVGEVGLKWLQEVKEKYNLLTTVEVANAAHVEKALKYKVDILWIGARTTVNPFSVQEIADALKGTDIPVMVKNPVHPDLQLWIGAVERISQAGIKKLLAVHRGFYNPNESIYRNDPFWEIAIELRTVFPELPVICDPSHISGKRELIKSVAQKAIDLGMEGLMIETHIHPAGALSDAKQQLTPGGLKNLLEEELVFRKPVSENADFKDKLFQLRQIIDELDEEMIQLLKRRNDVIEQIGEYKKDQKITIFQLERWMEILRTRTEWAAKKGFPKPFIEKLCQLMHEESIRLQTEIMNKNK
jgi:chorismate mutase